MTLARLKLCRRCRGTGALCRPKLKPTGSRCIVCRDCGGDGCAVGDAVSEKPISD